VPDVILSHVSKAYGSTAVVRDFSLAIRPGELIALLGPSGCGKTTTLRMIAGFILPSSGEIRIGRRNVTGDPPFHRSTGMVFQGYALFPHMTVADNVAFGLKMRKVGRAEIQARVTEALRLVRLDHLGGRYPRQLSGGQQQRVALARALVIKPDVLLLDEPLSNLDAKLRHAVRLEIRQLQQQLGLTTVFVTHDQEEALAIADRLVVMNQGVVAQTGTPQELYEAPLSAFVADFMGRSNFFAGGVAGPGLFRTRSGLELAFRGEAPASQAVLAVRPDRIALATGSEDLVRFNSIPARARAVTFLGPVTEIIADLASGETVIAHGPTASSGLTRVRAGDEIRLTWPVEAGRVLDASDWPINTGKSEDKS
jgi:putative spermidine/putrescine transport system ATP-binding protein